MRIKARVRVGGGCLKPIGGLTCRRQYGQAWVKRETSVRNAEFRRRWVSSCNRILYGTVPLKPTTGFFVC